jgi:mannose-1-phosphate guanylyltransferase
VQTNNSVTAVLLAAGLGTRLKPHTDLLPKCLMPIQGIPLLEIWIRTLFQIGINHIIVNLHYRSQDVVDFLRRELFFNKIKTSHEKKLLGTAGTLRANYNFLKKKTILLIHADNLCIVDFQAFLNFHKNHRPLGTSITMMAFETDTPETCGILELDLEGRVIKFHEKVSNPPGKLANAAIYLIEPEVLDYIAQNKLNDFSLEVIPKYMGRIATWKNTNFMRDIGNPFQLKEAQKVNLPIQPIYDNWFQNFQSHPIHNLI